jgi:hypothetical protein
MKQDSLYSSEARCLRGFRRISSVISIANKPGLAARAWHHHRLRMVVMVVMVVPMVTVLDPVSA